jgi:hypothetical protein
MYLFNYFLIYFLLFTSSSFLPFLYFSISPLSASPLVLSYISLHVTPRFLIVVYLCFGDTYYLLQDPLPSAATSL